MRFSSILVLASLVASSFATAASDILADVATINTQLNNLNNAIAAFTIPGGTLGTALAIHTNAVTLGTSLNKATTDTLAVSPNPLADADGRSILTAVEALENTIYSCLNGIVARKAAFTALPIGGIVTLVKQDLSNLNNSTASLEVALIGTAPASLVAEATALQSRINAAFAVAIQAYAS
ncbi:hypothetical protein H0H81_011708 [Sphagnurus paluster]|uniref:Hydrophobic surface binding protein n=1 Tax=Sphagnurus paluster TaxID=117069 RepID=A0A9P7GNL1_9AGAR|nr:hypothetical protein H0H81_011708 [Sphagnurus paluster]